MHLLRGFASHHESVTSFATVSSSNPQWWSKVVPSSKLETSLQQDRKSSSGKVSICNSSMNFPCHDAMLSHVKNLLLRRNGQSSMHRNFIRCFKFCLMVEAS